MLLCKYQRDDSSICSDRGWRPTFSVLRLGIYHIRHQSRLLLSQFTFHLIHLTRIGSQGETQGKDYWGRSDIPNDSRIELPHSFSFGCERRDRQVLFTPCSVPSLASCNGIFARLEPYFLRFGSVHVRYVDGESFSCYVW